MRTSILCLLLLSCISCGRTSEDNYLGLYSSTGDCLPFPKSYYAKAWDAVHDSLKPCNKAFNDSSEILHYCLSEEKQLQVSLLFCHSCSLYKWIYVYYKQNPYMLIYSGKDSSRVLVQAQEACKDEGAILQLVDFLREQGMGARDICKSLEAFYGWKKYQSGYVWGKKDLDLLGFSPKTLDTMGVNLLNPLSLTTWVSIDYYGHTGTIEYTGPEPHPPYYLKKYAIHLLYNSRKDTYAFSVKEIPIDRDYVPNVLDTLDRYF